MLTEEFFGILAICLSFLAYTLYMISIFKGKTKPHVYSWFNWWLLITIGAFAQDDIGGGASSWVLYVTSFNCFTITIAALFVGEKNITKSDTFTFMGALIAIPVWLMTENPLWALVILIIIDALSFFPTIRKTYLKPYSEDLAAYCIAGLRYFFALFAIGNVTFQTLIYPLFLMSLEWSFVLYLLWLRKGLASKTST